MPIRWALRAHVMGIDRPCVGHLLPILWASSAQSLGWFLGNMTVSSFVRARCLGYKPKNKLSNEEIKLLGNLAKCRIDMVNFANALSGLTNEQKLSLFRNYRVMFDWYERVVPITNAVVDYLQSVQKVNDFPSSST